jgi:hypothetical protein
MESLQSNRIESSSHAAVSDSFGGVIKTISTRFDMREMLSHLSYSSNSPCIPSEDALVVRQYCHSAHRHENFRINSRMLHLLMENPTWNNEVQREHEPSGVCAIVVPTIGSFIY